MPVRWGRWIILIAAAALPALATDQPAGTVVVSCPPASAGDQPSCTPSRIDLKRAKGAFSRALQLEKEKHLDEAYEQFDTAARLVPNNLNYVTALAITREELISQHVKQGNLDLEKALPIQAQAEFRNALALDPENQFAKQRLQDSLGEWTPEKNPAVQVVKSAGPATLEPKDERHDFDFRGDSHALLNQVAQTFGVTIEIDTDVPSRHVHFYVDNVDFFAAMREACAVTQSFWTPLSDKSILVVKDTSENHRQYDRLAMRTFYVGFATTPQAMQEITNVLRTVFDVKYLQPEMQISRFVVRAPVEVLDAVTYFLEHFGTARPQVVLDIQIFEVDRQLATDIGVHIPNNFNLFNIPAAAFAGLSGLGGQNIQGLINQLISSGGINQANSGALSGLLAQLQGQSSTPSVFSQPVATFGGGLTLMGLSLDQLTTTLSRNESLVKLLDHATLRASQGNDASFKLGQRYPVINASFAPIYNTSAISQVLQNGSFQAPIPSFNYEDLGLTIKAKPVISPDYKIGLQLEMELRNLAGQSLNGVPVIANRSFKSSINLENGEPAVVASSITVNEMKVLTGLPGLSQIPGLKNALSSAQNMEERDELLVLITPHIVSEEPPESSEVWLSK